MCSRRAKLIIAELRHEVDETQNTATSGDLAQHSKHVAQL